MGVGEVWWRVVVVSYVFLVSLVLLGLGGGIVTRLSCAHLSCRVSRLFVCPDPTRSFPVVFLGPDGLRGVDGGGGGAEGEG